MSANLKRRHQSYYVRVGVNPKHQKLIGKTETVRSLRTRDKVTAERIKNGVIQEIKDYHERLVREAQAGIQGFSENAMTLRGMIDDGSLEAGEDSRPEDDGAEILSNLLEERLAKRLSPSQINNLTAEDVDPSIRASFKMLKDPDYLPLSAAIKQYLNIVEKEVIPRTWDQKKKELEIFSKWVGEINISDVDRRLSSRYINQSLIPKGYAPNYNKAIVAILSAFFNWLIDNSLYDHANPFARKGKLFKGPKKGSSHIANRAWTSDELKKLFATLDATRKGTIKRKAGVAARIALYSGMRQEEICSMKTSAVNLKDGFMTVADAKNENSIRQVPIHAEIRGLVEGLIEESTDGYLIDGLPAGTRDKKRGHSLGNRFSDVKSELFPDSQPRELTFHGLRSTFITAMEQAGIPQSTAQLIDGHAKQSLSYGLYSKGPGLDALRDAVERVTIVIHAN